MSVNLRLIFATSLILLAVSCRSANDLGAVSVSLHSPEGNAVVHTGLHIKAYSPTSKSRTEIIGTDGRAHFNLPTGEWRFLILGNPDQQLSNPKVRVIAGSRISTTITVDTVIRCHLRPHSGS